MRSARDAESEKSTRLGSEYSDDPFPPVNIVMATHNGERHLGEQLESIRSQSYERWKLYISDDHSTDGTVSMIRDASARDPRIRLLPERTSGGSAQGNFMSAIRAVPPGLLMLSDQDDVWFTEKIQVSVAEAKSHAESLGMGVPFLIHTDARVTDASLNLIHASYKRFSALLNDSSDLGHALVENVVTGNTCLLSPDLLELARITDPATPMIMHDWWIYLIAACFGNVFYIDVPTLSYRQHGTNTVGALVGASFPEPKRARNAALRAAETVAQARSFLNIYGSIMTDDQREKTQAYARISSVPRWHRNRLLRRQGISKTRLNAAIIHRFAIAMLREHDVETALAL